MHLHWSLLVLKKHSCPCFALQSSRSIGVLALTCDMAVLVTAPSNRSLRGIFWHASDKLKVNMNLQGLGKTVTGLALILKSIGRLPSPPGNATLHRAASGARSFYSVSASSSQPGPSPHTPEPVSSPVFSSPSWSGPRSSHSNRRLTAKGMRHSLATCDMFLQAGLAKHHRDSAGTPKTPGPGPNAAASASVMSQAGQKASGRGASAGRSGPGKKPSLQAPRRRSSRHSSAPAPSPPETSRTADSSPAVGADEAYKAETTPIIIPDTTAHQIHGMELLTKEGKVEDRQCWVQCEMCNKWRLLPPDHQVWLSNSISKNAKSNLCIAALHCVVQHIFMT